MEKFEDGSFSVYYGGEHQYEFIDYLGDGGWKTYFNDNPIVYELK
jgi:hypothetical protein